MRKYTKVRSFDIDTLYLENGKVYDAVLELDPVRRVVAYTIEKPTYAYILVNIPCAYLKPGGKWEILANDYKEEESEPLNTVSVDSTEYKIKVMQAWLDGKEIEFSANHPDPQHWVRIDEPRWNWIGCSYRVKPYPKPSPKPSINWDHVHPDFKWLAVDRSGSAYLHENKPQKSDRYGAWIFGGEFSCVSAFLSASVPDGVNWEESLVERPK